jgi:large subunit ribosomal protein L24
MVTEFKSTWKKSAQPRRQRKYRFNAPRSVARKMVSAHLDKPLREKYGKRSFTLRVGDVVKVMRGNYKGKEGKVERVDLKKLKILVSGCEVIRVNGQKSRVKIDPSNVKIVDLKLDDKKRKESLERGNSKKE